MMRTTFLVVSVISLLAGIGIIRFYFIDGSRPAIEQATNPVGQPV